ncbi:hypothetical protein [Microbulbifer aggregans]|uniref:hypothetical protein n=1 Tax=Microbulbifer aggregans TaxID=1769779 RepID=UPI001CFC6A82|nr:hypothetical protein [Microbulbifer aggregans]
MDDLKQSAQELAEHEDLVGIYIASEDGELLLHVKGPKQAELGYIQYYLFGGKDEIRSTYAGLENMILPQMYAQGDERAVYSKLGNILYGLFYVENLHVLEHWEKSKLLSSRIESLVKNTPALRQYTDG